MKKIVSLLFMSTILCSAEPKRILIFGGKTGWIGQKIVAIIQEQGHTAICAQSRLEIREAIEQEIAATQPDYIINTAGITGKPNVDWCEEHKPETIRVNLIGTLNLIDIAYQHNLHITNISTGCIYEYDDQHPMYSGIGFTEEEKPNFGGSFYSRMKIKLEEIMLNYPNVLNLRVKMPISTELDKGFVGKIIHFKKVINIPNSLTILDDLLPIAVDMTIREIKGNFNFVNPGALSHHQVLDLYKEYVDPNFTYQGFTVTEQSLILKARRANAELSATKLLQLYPNIPPIREALISILKKIKQQQVCTQEK